MCVGISFISCGRASRKGIVVSLGMERFGRLLDGLKKSGVERVNSWYLQTKVIHEVEEWFQDAKTVSAG
jgi:hypothetical protein